jgi:hypothetical protein
MERMTKMEDRLIELIQESVRGCSRYWASVIAEHLIANGVSFGRDPGYGWIPTSLGLPEEDGSYIVRTTTGAVTTAHFYSAKVFPPTHYRPSEYRLTAKWQTNRNVTHWMPLPEPPEEV